MAALKGKLSKPLNQIEGRPAQRSAGVKGFKVYVEKDMSEACCGDSSDAQQKKSVTSSDRSTQAMASKYKGGAKTLQNQKAKQNSSLSVNVGRRVLADVSNLRGNSIKTKGQGGSKQLTTAAKALPLARKPSLILNTASKVDKTASHEKEKMRESRRIPLAPSRKSLPVPKLPSQVGTSLGKATAENMEKVTDNIHGFPVKAKVVQKVMAQVTNGRAHLWKNRVSDGFIQMASKGHSTVNGGAFPKKSVKPALKTTYGMSSARRPRTTLKPKYKEVSSLSGSSTTATEKHSVAEAPSDCGSDISRNTLKKDATKKSGRRKSFTSMLMESSKVQDEKDQCLEQKLPNIYDDDNPFEVSEYVDEIYHYHWTMEAQSGPLVNYMEMQTEITPQMRGILVNWLIEVHAKFDLMPETLYLTITLLDQYLSLVTIKKNELQLIGLTALLLASKYEDFWHPKVADLISISVISYTRDQMLEMEKTLLKKLKFRLNAPTPYIFMLRFLKASKSDKKLEDLSFYLIDLCMVDYQALRFKSSLVCASAIYVARCTLQRSQPWSQLLCIYSHYDESQLRDCAEMVLEIQKSAKKSKLNVTYIKYSRPEKSRVANVKPLDKLPLS